MKRLSEILEVKKHNSTGCFNDFEVDFHFEQFLPNDQFENDGENIPLRPEEVTYFLSRLTSAFNKRACEIGAEERTLHQIEIRRILKIEPVKNLSTMVDFSQALKELKEGKLIQRSAWNGRRLIKLHSSYINGYHKELQLKTNGYTVQDYPTECDLENKVVSPYIPSVADIWANDWKII